MTEKYAYVGFKPCGCMVVATLDDPQYSKDVGRDVTAFIRQGYTVKRIPCSEVREKFQECTHKKAQLELKGI